MIFRNMLFFICKFTCHVLHTLNAAFWRKAKPKEAPFCESSKRRRFKELNLKLHFQKALKPNPAPQFISGKLKLLKNSQSYALSPSLQLHPSPETKRRCHWECWIQMQKCWTNLQHFTWISMPPRACKMFSRPTSAPKAPSRCTLFPFSSSSSNLFSLFSVFHILSFVFISRLVGGAGDIKLTKDGNTLLKEMVSSLSRNSRSFDLSSGCNCV